MAGVWYNISFPSFLVPRLYLLIGYLIPVQTEWLELLVKSRFFYNSCPLSRKTFRLLKNTKCPHHWDLTLPLYEKVPLRSKLNRSFYRTICNSGKTDFYEKLHKGSIIENGFTFPNCIWFLRSIQIFGRYSKKKLKKIISYSTIYYNIVNQLCMHKYADISFTSVPSILCRRHELKEDANQTESKLPTPLSGCSGI